MTVETEYRVKLPQFEGPFDLLLHLVKINEMEITDISLAKLTLQYLQHIEKMRAMDLDVAGDFLVVAATLLQIKARYLLPDLGDEEEEEEEEIDELLTARELLEKLIEYRSFKEIVTELKQLEEQSSGVFYRYKMPEFFVPEEGREVVRGDMQLLFEAMAGVLRYVENRSPHTTLYEEYKVEDKIEYLQARLNETGELDVIEEFERCLNKMEIIVTFLGLLELIRLKRARVAQPGPEKEIRIYSIKEEINGGEQAAPPQDLNHHEQENQEAERTAEAEPASGDAGGDDAGEAGAADDEEVESAEEAGAGQGVEDREDGDKTPGLSA
ncbi:MAG: segregation/condensation protein A [Candidatus Sumerlaeota bacterium]|nr:segregation/condensation protein A [Candidatus Sumerlaeota bacterium]